MRYFHQTVQLRVPARRPLPAVFSGHAGADEMRDMGIAFRQHWPQNSTQAILSSVHVHATAVSPVLQAFYGAKSACFLWRQSCLLSSCDSHTALDKHAEHELMSQCVQKRLAALQKKPVRQIQAWMQAQRSTPKLLCLRSSCLLAIRAKLLR